MGLFKNVFHNIGPIHKSKISDEDKFPTKEELCELSHKRYLESLDGPTTCYDRWHRLLKVGMTVEFNGCHFIIDSFEVINETLPRLRTTSGALLVPHLCTIVKEPANA